MNKELIVLSFILISALSSTSKASCKPWPPVGGKFVVESVAKLTLECVATDLTTTDIDTKWLKVSLKQGDHTYLAILGNSRKLKPKQVVNLSLESKCCGREELQIICDEKHQPTNKPRIEDPRVPACIVDAYIAK